VTTESLRLYALGAAALAGGFFQAFELCEPVLFLLFVYSHTLIL
jgi:hypothetical protein